MGRRSGGDERPYNFGERVEMTPEQQATQKAAAEDLRQWRLSAPMSKVAEFKKLYDDGAIEIVKVDGIFGFTDDVLDYTFGLGKALGARAISTEITTASQEERAAQYKRLGQFLWKIDREIPSFEHGLPRTL
jgi:hypothetical protein